jgi:ADP-heptose:LPS heptosyltransferase
MQRPPAPLGRNPLDPRAIVVVPYGTGIGDLALQRGLLTAVQRRWPRATVALYAPAAARAYVPDGVRVLPRILGIPAWERLPGATRWWRLLGPLEWRAIEAAFRQIPLARVAHVPARALAQRYDLVIDLLGAFVDGVDFARDWLPPPPGRRTTHVVDVLADYLGALGVELSAEDRGRPLPLSRADRRWAASHLAACLAAGGGPVAAAPEGVRGRSLVLVNPHAGSSLKLPGDAFWLGLVRHLRGGGSLPLVVAGGSRTEEAAARRTADAGGVLLPRVPLSHLVALARHCAVTVSPDTGLLHLAALDGARWVGLFGATNPFLSGPYDRSRGRLVIAAPPRTRACLTCWQRFTVGSACCPEYGTGSCLSTLSPAHVAREALTLAGGGTPS